MVHGISANRLPGDVTFPEAGRAIKYEVFMRLAARRASLGRPADVLVMPDVGLVSDDKAGTLDRYKR
jgi:hypothetical protein